RLAVWKGRAALSPPALAKEGNPLGGWGGTKALRGPTHKGGLRALALAPVPPVSLGRDSLWPRQAGAHAVSALT
ncbi:hypothetical protein QR98_0022850, partial [Sarcoptes scabiei]